MQYATTTCVYWAGGTSYVTGASATSYECIGEVPITYHDWLFVSGIQIFLFSFIAIGLIFSLLKQKK